MLLLVAVLFITENLKEKMKPKLSESFSQVNILSNVKVSYSVLDKLNSFFS